MSNMKGDNVEDGRRIWKTLAICLAGLVTQIFLNIYIDTPEKTDIFYILYVLFDVGSMGVFSAALISFILERYTIELINKSVRSTFLEIIYTSFSKLYSTQSDDEINNYKYYSYIFLDDNHIVRQSVCIDYTISNLPDSFYIIVVEDNNYNGFLNDKKCIYRWSMPSGSNVKAIENFSIVSLKIDGEEISPKKSVEKEYVKYNFKVKNRSSGKSHLELMFECKQSDDKSHPITISEFINKRASNAEFHINFSHFSSSHFIKSNYSHISPLLGTDSVRNVTMIAMDGKQHGVKFTCDDPVERSSSILLELAPRQRLDEHDKDNAKRENIVPKEVRLDLTEARHQ